ncbi:MAG: hypothetical protein SNJ69_05150 [Chloroflexaceae bacterium]
MNTYPLRLTNNALIDFITPAWSPDGSKIAFAAGLDGTYNIYVMNAGWDRQHHSRLIAPGRPAALRPAARHLIAAPHRHADLRYLPVQPGVTRD